MFGKRVTLFKLLGFEIRLDMSWIFIAVLITWTLAGGYFPYRNPGLAPLTYWLMGAVGALGLFVSIILHELSHSLVARSYGMPMKGITLFLFGGVAEMGDEPSSPKVEFLMSIVGPLSSIAIGFAFYGLFVLGTHGLWPVPVTAVLEYLAAINVLLACFNLIPAFPLDGGRILRSILWKLRNDMRWATRISSRIGSGFGILFFAFAIYNILTGNFIGGIWWFLIGMFLRMAAQTSYQQLLLRRALEGEPIRRFMKTDPVTVSPSISIQEFVDDYVYRYHYDMFPVAEGGRLLGCIATRNVKEISRAAWKDTNVRDRMTNVCAENSLSPDTDSVDALAAMKRTGNTRLMVTDGERLIGILALKDLLEFFSLKVELEGEKD
jgi:Zn-dependent protease/CBS domain-containing protein